MLHNKFQASEPSGSEEEDFLIFFFMYFYDSNQGTPGPGPSWFLGPLFKQTWKKITRQCHIPKFKHLSHVLLKKKIFEYFFLYFYGSNIGPPGTPGILDPKSFV